MQNHSYNICCTEIFKYYTYLNTDFIVHMQCLKNYCNINCNINQTDENNNISCCYIGFYGTY